MIRFQQYWFIGDSKKPKPNAWIQARKMQDSGWKPRWFAKDNDSGTYQYKGGYWEARENGNWESCPNIFGQVPKDPSSTT